MIRKLLKYILILVVVALLGVGVWKGLELLQELDNVQQEHLAVLELHEQMLANVRGSVIHITEQGEERAQVTLAELGLLQEAEAAVHALFTADDLLSDEAFRDLSVEQQQAWAEQPQPAQRAIRINGKKLDASSLLALLEATPRTQPVNATVAYEDGRFFIIPAVDGNSLNHLAIQQALEQAIEEFVITQERAGSFFFELTSTNCYLKPEISEKNTELDFADALARQARVPKITVQFHNAAFTLSDSTILRVVDVTDEGQVVVDEEALWAQVLKWSDRFPSANVPFVLDSYAGGLVTIPFVEATYVPDLERLYADLIPLLEKLESGQVTVGETCVDSTGAPHPLTVTYVEVDVVNQLMTYVKDGEVVLSTPVVTGNNLVSATPQGLYETGLKQRQVWLRGDTWNDFVEYWISITPQHNLGLHDASWRSEFGGTIYLENGSHGCVNTPTEAMKTLYELLEPGIPVLVYHREVTDYGFYPPQTEE